MKRYIFLIVGVIVSIVCSAKSVTFLNKEHQPIVDVRCVVYAADNDSVTTLNSDKKGIVNLKDVTFDYMVASHPDYSDKILYSKNLDNNAVVLTPGVRLSEVVVTPSDMEEFATHTSYRISEKDMGRYPTVLQSLNEIPNLTVLLNGSVFYEGNENVKVLIDGVDASPQEVQTLSKEDIAKVDVYKTPPARFMAQGVFAVVDVRLKSKIIGGNGAFDITQAFYPLKGNNSAAFYYNYKQSRFSLQYFNENSHYKKERQSETLDYDFNGVNYKKEKEGLDSKSHFDDNNLKLSYQINKPQDFLYNVSAGMAFNRDGETFNQIVRTGDKSFYATNYLHTGFTRYMVRNYFEKNLGAKAGTILANVNYSHFSTSYNSIYNEQSDDELAVNDSRSRYKTNMDAVFSEFQYQFHTTKLGYIYIVAYENYKHSKYVDSPQPFSQTSNLLGGQIQWIGWKQRVSWYAIMGVNWYHTASSNVEKANNLCIPSPRVNITWKPNSRVWLQAEYSYYGEGPSIAELSESNQWIDTKLVYHGNSALKPYKTHIARLGFGWNSKYVNLSVFGAFMSSPGRICDMYTLTENYMLQTLVNLSRYKSLSAQADVTIKPLGDNRLVFWNRVILEDLRGRNMEYKWDGHRIQWMSTLTLNLEHWTAELYYQYPGKVVDGQVARPRAQAWSVSLLYRPMTNLSVGLEWFMPFGNGFKESEYTVHEAPVYSDIRTNIRDWSNMVSIKLSYNFSFGRNRNHAKPQYNNGDDDTGILRK